jgi:hypothetical protein
MNLKVVGGLLLLAGMVLVLYRGYTYLTDKPDINVGTIQLRVGRVAPSNAPLYAGMVAIVAGGALLVMGVAKAD